MRYPSPQGHAPNGFRRIRESRQSQGCVLTHSVLTASPRTTGRPSYLGAPLTRCSTRADSQDRAGGLGILAAPPIYFGRPTRGGGFREEGGQMGPRSGGSTGFWEGEHPKSGSGGRGPEGIQDPTFWMDLIYSDGSVDSDSK